MTQSDKDRIEAQAAKLFDPEKEKDLYNACMVGAYAEHEWMEHEIAKNGIIPIVMSSSFNFDYSIKPNEK